MLKFKRNNQKLPKFNYITGKVYIHSTFNNTIVTITDSLGNTLSWSSAGSNGFKGSRKGTPFAAQIASETALLNASNFGLKKVDIIIKGQGKGRETAIRAVQNAGLQILSVKDMTSVPHNGCRPPQKRRV